MNRCKNCVTRITPFCATDDDICPFCYSDYGEVSYKGEAKLIEILDKHRNSRRQGNNKYDCIVPISGGKDSIYTLYKMVKAYNMHPLAFHYDNGFLDAQAKLNVENAVKILNVDLVINTNNNLQLRYLKKNFMEIPKQPVNSLGRLFSILCVGCAEGYVEPANTLAMKHGISLVIQGGCPVEKNLKWINPSNPGASGKKARILLAMRELQEIMTTPIFFDLRYSRNILRHLTSTTMLMNYATSKFFRKKSKVAREHYFHYCKWDENEIVETLESNLKWRRAEGRSSTTRFDCRLHLILDALCSKYLGISDKEMTYSLMIRRNMIKRTEAIQRLETEITEEEKILPQTLKEITSILGYGEHSESIVNNWFEKLGVNC